MRNTTVFLLILLGSLFFVPVQASELGAVDKRIRTALATRLPDVQPDAIAESALANLYEVTFGTHVVYVDGDGRYLISGDMLDLLTGQSLTDQRTQGLKATALANLDEKDMIIYGDKDAPHTVTVFTDIDCGYCRKLHSEMDEYNAAGIRIRYLAYPRAGIPSAAAKAAESVWCAEDRNQAMTLAKNGQSVESKSCNNPVADHYKLGQQFAIRGTPALILENGDVIPGYVPPKRLKQALVQKVASN